MEYKTLDSNTNKTGSTTLKERTTPDSRNTPSTTNLEEEETVDAPGNDGNASMPELVKRPNPWRKMITKMIFGLTIPSTITAQFLYYLYILMTLIGWSQWTRGLRRRSAVARLLRLWFRISPGAWMSVCCECCVLSRRGVRVGLIIRPEESYRLWCLVACDLETSQMRRPWPAEGSCAKKKKLH